jgi:hypothetical protein
MALQMCGSGNKVHLKKIGCVFAAVFWFVATSFIRKILVPVDRKVTGFMKYLRVVCDYISVGPTHCI